MRTREKRPTRRPRKSLASQPKTVREFSHDECTACKDLRSAEADYMRRRGAQKKPGRPWVRALAEAEEAEQSHTRGHDYLLAVRET